MEDCTKRKFSTALRILSCILLPFILFSGWLGLIFVTFLTADYVHIALYCSTVVLILLFLISMIIGRPKWKVRLISLGVVLGVLAAVFIGNQCYQNWVKNNRLDDQGVDLTEYEPFAENTKAVSLDHPSSLRFAGHEKLPRLDGATALYPLYAAFARAVYPQENYPAYSGSGQTEQVICSNTVHSFERLLYGAADIIFTAAPSAKQTADAEKMGVELCLTPIGKEAFVFFVNRKNPLDSLTVEQIKGIYSGEITNWRQLGGKNKAIRAFQRPENSGSQSTLRRMMGNTPLMSPPQENEVDGMGGIIHKTAAYQNQDSAIGYSFLFFATEMVRDNKIKLLHLDGIAPTRENIRNGTYPAVSEFYAITNGTPDSSEQKLIDWILSDQGQEIVGKTGYTPLK